MENGDAARPTRVGPRSARRWRIALALVATAAAGIGLGYAIGGTAPIRGPAPQAVEPKAAGGERESDTGSEDAETSSMSADVDEASGPETTKGLGTEWRRVDVGAELFADADVFDVARGGPGFVAVGAFRNRGGAVWTSQDGRKWSAVPWPDAERQVPTSLASRGAELVAVGVETVSADGVDVRMAFWTSVDGLSWTRGEHDDVVLTGQMEFMPTVVSTSRGWFAMAYDGSSTVLWSSDDGVAWSRAATDDRTFEGSVLVSLAEGGPGLVGVGFEIEGGGIGRPSVAVWVSDEGGAWSRVELGEGVFEDAWMVSVVPGGPGLVAVGSSKPVSATTDAAAVWTSEDGLTWEQVPPDEAVFGGDGDEGISAVTSTESSFVAVGGDKTGARVWTSPDGLTWSRVSAPEIFAGGGMLTVASGELGLVAIGRSQVDAWTEAVTIWTSP
jgi:hypothetical protein